MLPHFFTFTTILRPINSHLFMDPSYFSSVKRYIGILNLIHFLFCLYIKYITNILLYCKVLESLVILMYHRVQYWSHYHLCLNDINKWELSNFVFDVDTSLLNMKSDVFYWNKLKKQNTEWNFSHTLDGLWTKIRRIMWCDKFVVGDYECISDNIFNIIMNICEHPQRIQLFS